MGELLSFMVTPGNVDDREPLKNKTFVELLFGKLVGDKILLRKRAIIETTNDELKNIAQIEHSRHRSVTGFTVNLMAGLAAYSFFPKKPMIAVERIEPEENGLIQLSLF